MVNVDVKTNARFEELEQSMTAITSGKGISNILLSLLAGGAFIWGGLSGDFILRFTNSGKALAAAGVLILIYAIVAIKKLFTKEKASTILDKFLKEAE